MIVDAKNAVVGRVASKVAKAAIKGEKVVVLNAEHAIMVGNKESILEKFEARTTARVLGNPHYGPKYSRIPSKMLRRTIRGMLPNKPRTTERLLKLVTVYNTVPDLMPKEDIVTFEDVKCNERHNRMTLGEIAKILGGRW